MDMSQLESGETPVEIPTVVDVSGNEVLNGEPPAEVPTGVDVSGNELLYAYQLEALPPPPDVLTFADLLNEQAVVQSKEQADKALLETIGGTPVANLRPKLVEWVMKGCPSAYPILSLDIQPPAKCSDGEVRDLASYIEFCSGKTILQHVSLLQAKLPDIELSIANIQGKITVVVLKA